MSTLLSLRKRLGKVEQQVADRARREEFAHCICGSATVAVPGQEEEFEAKMNVFVAALSPDGFALVERHGETGAGDGYILVAVGAQVHFDAASLRIEAEGTWPTAEM